MATAPKTARSERTREALRRAAMVRFLAQGVEETTAEQIAADAGVSVRTFYRHFPSKHDLLFADYDAGLQWFRRALTDRPSDEPVVESVQAAIFAFPYDVEAVSQIARLRSDELDPTRIVRHMREVQSDFAHAIIEHLHRRNRDADELAVAVTARCIAAATFAGMEVWMRREERNLADLAELSRQALASIADGMPIR